MWSLLLACGYIANAQPADVPTAPPTEDAPDTEETPGAEDASAAPAEVLELSGGLDSLSEDSALDSFEQSVADTPEMTAAERAALPPGLRLVAGRSRVLMRGRLSARPLLLVVGAQGEDGGQAGVGLGGALLHRWWPLGDDERTIGGETRLEAVYNLGAPEGYQLALSSLVGAWRGPLGVHAGPSLRYDAAVWEEAGVTQQAGLLAGGRLLTSIALGPVNLYAGADLAGGLTADRQLEWMPLGGVMLQRGWIQLLSRASWRVTPDGALWTAGLGVHIQPQL